MNYVTESGCWGVFLRDSGFVQPYAQHGRLKSAPPARFTLGHNIRVSLMHKKPRGTPSHFSITTETGQPPREMETVKLELPAVKADIENVVARKFAVDALDYDVPFQITSPPVQNQENDIDFTVDTNLGRMGLELVEYAPVGKAGFSGPLPTTYSPVERGREVLALIAKKAKKYQHYDRLQKKMLLVYVTDNAWALDIHTLSVIQFLGRTEITTFDYVTYYKPMEGTGGIVCRLYPVSDAEYEKLGPRRIPS